MLKDQKFVMDSVKKMQNILVDKNVLKPEERVPTEPVVSHPNNMEHFNNSVKNQINTMITNTPTINNNTKNKLQDFIKQNKQNKQF